MKPFYRMYEPDGVIIKNGKEVRVPVNNSIAPHYPLPSECDEWIELFTNLKNNFTDEEIKELNHKCWYNANQGIYDDKPSLD